MVEDLRGEVFYSHRFQLTVLLTVEVQVEPMSQLDLEEDTDKILTLFFWYVDKETTAEVI